jgi:hypothetical protein
VTILVLTVTLKMWICKRGDCIVTVIFFIPGYCMGIVTIWLHFTWPCFNHGHDGSGFYHIHQRRDHVLILFTRSIRDFEKLNDTALCFLVVWCIRHVHVYIKIACLHIHMDTCIHGQPFALFFLSCRSCNFAREMWYIFYTDFPLIVATLIYMRISLRICLRGCQNLGICLSWICFLVCEDVCTRGICTYFLYRFIVWHWWKNRLGYNLGCFRFHEILNKFCE